MGPLPAQRRCFIQHIWHRGGFMRMNAPGMENHDILMGAVLSPPQWKTASPKLCDLLLLACALAAALLVPAEQAALPPPACSRLDWEVLSMRGWWGGELAHSILPLEARITGEDTRLLHPHTCTWVGIANIANSWQKRKKTHQNQTTTTQQPGPHNISVAITDEICGLELK